MATSLYTTGSEDTRVNTVRYGHLAVHYTLRGHTSQHSQVWPPRCTLQSLRTHESTQSGMATSLYTTGSEDTRVNTVRYGHLAVHYGLRGHTSQHSQVWPPRCTLQALRTHESTQSGMATSLYTTGSEDTRVNTVRYGHLAVHYRLGGHTSQHSQVWPPRCTLQALRTHESTQSGMATSRYTTGSEDTRVNTVRYGHLAVHYRL